MTPEERTDSLVVPWKSALEKTTDFITDGPELRRRIAIIIEAAEREAEARGYERGRRAGIAEASYRGLE